MAKVEKIIPFIKKWEGGFVNDKYDLGGATNIGVTIATYEAYCRKKGYPSPTIERLKVMSEEQWKDILKTMYWDRWQADRIICQPIANILVDWVWASGVYGIKIPQRMLGVVPDGIVGRKTLAAVNEYKDQHELFLKIKKERKAFIETICKRRPTNNKFKKGWLNRLNDLRFDYV